MSRLPFATCILVMMLSSVCLAIETSGFPSPESPQEERLAAAVRSGDLAAVKTAAEHVHVKDKDRLRHYVLRHGSGVIARYLNAYAELDIEELQIAVLEDDLETVKRLLPDRPQRPPTALRNDEHSPLRLAIRRDNVPMVKLLIGRNVSVDDFMSTSRPPGRNPTVLSEAIQLGNAKIVRLLVKTGVTLDKPGVAIVPKAQATFQGKPVSQLLGSFWWKSLAADADHKRLAAEKKALLQELLDKGLAVRSRRAPRQFKLPFGHEYCYWPREGRGRFAEGGSESKHLNWWGNASASYGDSNRTSRNRQASDRCGRSCEPAGRGWQNAAGPGILWQGRHPRHAPGSRCKIATPDWQ